MSEENSNKYSDEELDRILSEYANIGRNRNRSDSSDTPISKPRAEHGTARSFNSRQSTDNGNDTDIKSNATYTPSGKKFVLHIDESIIDDPVQSNTKKDQNGTGGIYFSSYQRKRPPSSPEVTASNTPVKRADNVAPAVRRTSSASSTKESDNVPKDGNKKNKKAIGGKAAIVFFVMILIFTTVFSSIGISCVGDMLAVNRSEENIEVEIEPDSTYVDVINVLAKNKLIKQKLFCIAFTKYREYDKKTFLSGNYYLNSKMGVEGMLRELMEAPVSAETVTLSFPEGYTTSEIFQKLAKYDVGDANKLYSAARSDTYNSYSFIDSIKSGDSRYLKLDGYLFPDTYDFYVGADANYIIKKFLDNFEAKWEDEYDKRAQKLGYSRDEIIIIASIIQKEAANNDQMRLVSSVIHNRLRNKANFPTLGCDSTKDYINNFVRPVVGDGKADFYLSKYSTSSNAGLPPGPICNPGLEAIKAALYPDDTDYYFFCHDDSRKIYLARTQKEHDANIVKVMIANAKDAQN